jgi:hypothetical protein
MNSGPPKQKFIGPLGAIKADGGTDHSHRFE